MPQTPFPNHLQRGSDSRRTQRGGVCRAVGLFVLVVVAGFANAREHGKSAPSPAGPGEGAAAVAHVITIAGEVATPLRLDAATLATYARTTVDGNDHGTRGQWAGVRLIDLLEAAGVPSGETLRGAALQQYVRVDASDGYAVVFALAELDAKFSDDTIILADTRDGKPLSAHEGPFRIIASGDKRPGRWIRQVRAITVLKAAESS